MKKGILFTLLFTTSLLSTQVLAQTPTKDAGKTNLNNASGASNAPKDIKKEPENKNPKYLQQVDGSELFDFTPEFTALTDGEKLNAQAEMSKQNRNEIFTTDKKVDINSQGIVKANRFATDVQTKVRVNSTTIVLNKNKLEGSLEKNKKHIEINANRLHSLENTVRDIKKHLHSGLAANAAISGLFQPYGIGKFNLTMALGGFRSEQAFAIGSGYRLDENLAMKIGVAYTGSHDVMYNAGINLEW